MSEKVRTRRLDRALALARVGARTGVAMATSLGTEAAARHALTVLGELRGLATKIGQTLSYVDGVVPVKHRETYEAALRQLQRAVPISSPEHVRRLVERELGAPLEQCFEEWSTEPVASASIGQVHRARLRDGTPVAVKVQHRDIEAAIESDLSNVSSIIPLIGLVLPAGVDPAGLLDEVTARFREELDYRLEAQRTRAFGDFWAGEEGVLVPRVVATHSSQRVLTTTWLEGKTLEEVVDAAEPVRRAYAERLWTFVFRSLLVGGAFNADPHPGNYFFRASGGVAFLDFGCVQLLPEDARRAAVKAHRAAAERNMPEFHQGMSELLGLRPGKFAAAALEYVELCFAPVIDSPFRITRQWVAQLTKAGQAFKSAMFGRGANLTLPPPHLAMMNRLQFGFYSVLARLDVDVDYRAIETSLVKEAEHAGSAAIRRAVSGEH